MPRSLITRSINAPVDVVFDTVAHIENFRKAVPHIVNVEFLSDTQKGVGTKFRETRLMNGREGTVDLEVTEYELNKSIRIVSDAGGTIWDTEFRVEPEGNGTLLTLDGESRPYKLLARIVVPLMNGMFKKAVEKDMDAVKAYCEGLAD